jgi:hypothetical protein
MLRERREERDREREGGREREIGEGGKNENRKKE